MKPRLLSIFGARPQFIKAAPLIHAIEEVGDFEHLGLHTGQHFDQNMSEVFFRELAIPAPLENLEVGPGTHAKQTGKMMVGIEKFLLRHKPDMLLVYGDTNSTLAGATAGVRLGLPIAHIEAGLRSFNRRMPEEINRIVADRFADLLFAPTKAAQKNLLTEGFAEQSVHLVGDLMVDAVQKQSERAAGQSKVLEDLGLAAGEYLLATFHRQENTDDPARLRNIWEALRELSESNKLVLPLHPRTRQRLEAEGLSLDAEPGPIVTEALGYLDTLHLLANSKLLLTDSGGMQKEAFALGLPTVTLRAETEWLELVEAGANRLADPSSKQTILEAAKAMENVRVDPSKYDFYGAGRAAERIHEQIKNYVEKG